MTTQNAQIEQCTWRESLIPSPMACSHPFPTPLLHSPVNEKFAFLGREVGRSDGAGSQTTTYNVYGEVTAEKFPLSTNSSTAPPATGKNRANFFMRNMPAMRHCMADATEFGLVYFQKARRTEDRQPELTETYPLLSRAAILPDGNILYLNYVAEIAEATPAFLRTNAYYIEGAIQWNLIRR